MTARTSRRSLLLRGVNAVLEYLRVPKQRHYNKSLSFDIAGNYAVLIAIERQIFLSIPRMAILIDRSLCAVEGCQFAGSTYLISPTTGSHSN